MDACLVPAPLGGRGCAHQQMHCRRLLSGGQQIPQLDSRRLGGRTGIAHERRQAVHHAGMVRGRAQGLAEQFQPAAQGGRGGRIRALSLLQVQFRQRLPQRRLVGDRQAILQQPLGVVELAFQDAGTRRRDPRRDILGVGSHAPLKMIERLFRGPLHPDLVVTLQEHFRQSQVQLGLLRRDLLKALSGLLRIASGQIQLGQPLVSLLPIVRRGQGLLQVVNQFPAARLVGRGRIPQPLGQPEMGRRKAGPRVRSQVGHQSLRAAQVVFAFRQPRQGVPRALPRFIQQHQLPHIHLGARHIVRQ